MNKCKINDLQIINYLNVAMCTLEGLIKSLTNQSFSNISNDLMAFLIFRKP